MQNEKELIIDFIRETSNYLYDKEVFFYDDDLNKWYSRKDCKYITLEEVLEQLKESIVSLVKDNNV